MNINKIKYLRELKGYTQNDIANKIGVSRGTYGGWEVKNDNIPLIKFNKVCNILNTSMDYISDIETEYIEIKSKDINFDLLPKRLKETRVLHNDKEKETAKILGIDRTTYSKYETGTNIIQTEYLIMFAKHYKVSVDWLCGR